MNEICHQVPVFNLFYLSTHICIYSVASKERGSLFLCACAPGEGHQSYDGGLFLPRFLRWFLENSTISHHFCHFPFWHTKQVPKKVPKKGAQIIKGAQGAQLSVTFQYHFVGIKHLVKLSSHFWHIFLHKAFFQPYFLKISFEWWL